MQVCKQCGKRYYTDQPICPECTRRYNEVYNRSNLTDNFKVKRRSISYKSNRSITLIISFVFSILFLFYFIINLGATIANQTDSTSALAAGIMSFLLLPFLILMFIGIVLHLVGLITLKRGFILSAGILYIVSGVFNLLFIIPIAIISIFTFVAYSQIE
ncbi:MAG: hypothetical protein ACYDEX_24835 [Mobilitalea sp.]